MSCKFRFWQFSVVSLCELVSRNKCKRVQTNAFQEHTWLGALKRINSASSETCEWNEHAFKFETANFQVDVWLHETWMVKCEKKETSNADPRSNLQSWNQMTHLHFFVWTGCASLRFYRIPGNASRKVLSCYARHCPVDIIAFSVLQVYRSLCTPQWASKLRHSSMSCWPNMVTTLTTGPFGANWKTK